MQEKNIDTINSVMSISEAAQVWGQDRSVLSKVVTRKNGRFTHGVDWRQSAGTTLVTVESMNRIYGNPNHPKELAPGISKKTFEDKLGMTRVGKQRLIPGDKGNGNKFTHAIDRVVYRHSSGHKVARILNVWFIVEGEKITDKYITDDDKLYENGKPDPDNLNRLGFV